MKPADIINMELLKEMHHIHEVAASNPNSPWSKAKEAEIEKSRIKTEARLKVSKTKL